MITPRLHVQQGSGYPCFIGEGILSSLGEIADSLAAGGKRIVISSPRVDELYGDVISAALPDAISLRFDDGENEKTLSNVRRLLDRMLQLPVRRDTVAFVVGGGVVGDAAGFACSIVLRGIRFIHVPTTLLAQVDSSIGGKVAVNHATGKNLIGAFAAPAAVVSDVGTLSTLSERELRSGMFEALKSGVIGDRILFDEIEAHNAETIKELAFLESVVVRSVEVKAAIVSADEREADLRRLLNYGHTIGHAIETATRFELLSHGDAVGWGMIAANALAERRGLLGRTHAAQITEAVRLLGPQKLPALDRNELSRLTESDKKFTERRKVMALPVEIGRCVVVDDVTEQELLYAIDAMLEAAKS